MYLCFKNILLLSHIAINLLLYVTISDIYENITNEIKMFLRILLHLLFIGLNVPVDKNNDNKDNLLDVKHLLLPCSLNVFETSGK